MEGASLGQETVVTQQSVVLRPHAHLFTRGIVAVLALTTPVFAVLYWLTIPDGGWPRCSRIHILVVVATVLAVLAFFGTTIQLAPRQRARTRVLRPCTDIRPGMVGSVVLLDLYEGSTLDTLPQLFVTDADGRLLLRLRGQFWSREDMERVAEELDVPVTRSPSR